jgi:hypothetical protein
MRIVQCHFYEDADHIDSSIQHPWELLEYGAARFKPTATPIESNKAETLQRGFLSILISLLLTFAERFAKIGSFSELGGMTKDDALQSCACWFIGHHDAGCVLMCDATLPGVILSAMVIPLLFEVMSLEPTSRMAPSKNCLERNSSHLADRCFGLSGSEPFTRTRSPRRQTITQQ